MKTSSTIISNPKKSIRIIAYSLFALAGIILFSLTVMIIYQNRQIITNTTSMKPEKFTELYFEDNTHLPIKINKDLLNKPIADLYSFRFTIHNLENKDMKYTYAVYLLDPEKIIFDQGEINIKINESKTIDEKFYMPSIYPRTKVVVNLVDQNQLIFFWMKEKLQ